MKNNFSKKVILFIFSVLTLLVTILAICSCSNTTTETYSCIDDLDGKKIGVLNGSIYGNVVKERLPDASVSYFNSRVDLVSALKAGKINAFTLDDSESKVILEEQSEIGKIDEALYTFDYSYGFSKSEHGEKIMAEFNQFLDELKSENKIDAILDKWLNEDDPQMSVDYTTLPNINGNIVLGTNAESIPYDYYSQGMFKGFEIEIVALFCQHMGYSLEIENMLFAGLIASLENKTDIICACITVTEERKESINFSNSIISGHGGLVVLKKNLPGYDSSLDEENNSFFENFIHNFKNTFIEEDRWVLLKNGLIKTLIITLVSIILGTILGYYLFIICRHGNKAANLTVKILNKIMSGLPMVVLLMIFYYIIFGSTKLDGTIVSIVVFTLMMGCKIYGIIKNSVNSISIGQTEAALTLGYKEKESFNSIVLPQALPNMITPYTGSIVSVIHASSIVGYIAVQDLTQMGDIIRSQTYEAFMPLITVALVYYVLAFIMIRIVKLISKRIDPHKKDPAKILNGVTTH